MNRPNQAHSLDGAEHGCLHSGHHRRAAPVMRVVRACMKAIPLLCSLFLLAAFACGQVYYTNSVTRADAIKAASKLKVGMWEEDASKVLSTNGLTNAMSIGAVTGWDRCYGLSDGTSLHLDYRARSIARDGRWGGNGELRRAFIQSNGVNIVFITLTNAP